MIKILKALSALLTYPTAELQQAAGEIGEVVAAGQMIPPRIRQPVTCAADRIRHRRSL